MKKGPTGPFFIAKIRSAYLDRSKLGLELIAQASNRKNVVRASGVILNF